jgi:CheY-like chemotaxis protein
VHLCSLDKYGESTAVHKKVLIIDDSPAEIKLMQGLLEKEGYWPIGLNDPKRVEETITTW